MAVQIIPRKEIRTCDICNETIDKSPKMEIKVKRKYQQDVNDWCLVFGYEDLDICDKCAKEMIEFIKSKREEE